MTNEVVVCCFCGEPLPEPESVLIVAYPTPDREEIQNLYSHRSCFAMRLHPDVPVHPAFAEDM